MAKITIEELSGSLREYLNGLGLTEAQVQGLIDKFEDEKIGDISQLSTEEKESLVGAINEVNQKANKEVDLSNYQQKTDNSLQTSSKNLVGAINELFQNANNGKELIASAIGEPLSKEDTFSAMSTDINRLLSTFKTNMMNNGVAVESGDKFKQLIDKIATMVEEGKHKGIKIVPGSTWVLDSKTGIHASSVGSPSSVVYTNNIIPFGTISINIQEQFLTNYPDRWMNTEVYLNDVLYYQTNKLVSNSYNSTTLTSNKTIEMFITKGDVIKILPKVSTSYNVQQAYDTIKLSCNIEGSEDTTLRDTLASILQEEGVSVTEEDDMASLISKVDSEFDRKNNEIENSGGLDIITATKLPEEVVENQIVIITDNIPTAKKIKDSSLSTPSIDGEVIVGIVTIPDDSGVEYNMLQNDIVVPLYLKVAKGYFDNRVTTYDAYIGINGNWIQFSKATLLVFDNGVDNLGINNSSNWTCINATLSQGEWNLGVNISGHGDNSWRDSAAWFKTKFDLTNYKTLKITGTANSSATVGFTKSPGTTASIEKSIPLKTTSSEITVDVSSLSGEYYLLVKGRTATSTYSAFSMSRFELLP